MMKNAFYFILKAPFIFKGVLRQDIEHFLKKPM